MTKQQAEHWAAQPQQVLRQRADELEAQASKYLSRGEWAMAEKRFVQAEEVRALI